MEEEPQEPKKQLKVDLPMLEAALDNHDSTFEFYLDTETGSILSITEDLRLQFQDFLEDLDLDDEEAIESGDRERMIQVLKEQEEIELLEMYLVDSDTEDRYLQISPEDHRAGYRAMEAFIQTLENRALQNHLANAIHGKGAFRNFKNTLGRYPKELERWYAFRNRLSREAALRWLDLNGIESI